MTAFDESVLDSPDRLFAADPGGMLRSVATAGAQLREARALADEAGIGDVTDGVPPRAVIVVGDGPAGYVGDLLRALSGPDATAPTASHYGPPPRWLSSSDVLLTASYSGVDQDLLGSVEVAARRGLPMLGAGPRDTPLAEVVAGRGRSPYVALPLREPARASFWALAAPLLLGAARSGLSRLIESDLAAAADTLDEVSERCRPDSDIFVNPAKSLAVELAAGPPVLWGSTPLAGVAARMLAVALAGNAGRLAVSGTLPYAAREYGGLLDVPAAADDFFRDRVDEPEAPRSRLFLLRDDRGEDDAALACVERIREQAGRSGIGVTELVAEGERPLARFASLLAPGEFASVYCGLAAGFDPAGVRTGER